PGGGASDGLAPADDGFGSADGSEPIEPLSYDPIEVADFERCEGHEHDPRCIASEDACICGRPCHGYGPAGYPDTCPLGDFHALCSNAEILPVCIIPCTTDDQCPDPGMVCRPCPAPFDAHCHALGQVPAEAGFNFGPHMCTWADP